MEPNEHNQSENTPEPRPFEKKESGIGAIIGVIVIIIIVMFGAFYLLDVVRERSTNLPPASDRQQETMQTESPFEEPGDPSATSSEATSLESFSEFDVQGEFNAVLE